LYADRTLCAVQKRGVIPNALFYDIPVRHGKEREKWFDDGLTKLGEANFLFFDPDNGIGAGIKHIKQIEIERACDNKILILYQHTARYKSSRERDWIKEKLNRFKEMRGLADKKIYVYKAKQRFFFIIWNEDNNIDFKLEDICFDHKILSLYEISYPYAVI
jgi:hypothetical protein